MEERAGGARRNERSGAFGHRAHRRGWGASQRRTRLRAPFSQRSMVCMIRDGALHAARSDDNAQASTAHASGGAAESMGSRSSARAGSCRSLAHPAAGRWRSSSRRRRHAASPFGRSHAVTIAFADPERAPEADGDLLARLYGFTAREAAVAALLVRGCSPSETAAELAMTENTVRTHIRHVFDKTGVERLADLVRILMQGPGVRGR